MTANFTHRGISTAQISTVTQPKVCDPPPKKHENISVVFISLTKLVTLPSYSQTKLCWGH